MQKDKSTSIIPAERIEGVIYFIRGNKVMLDEDLASLYVVQTKVLNQAVRRNPERFPKDFAFQLSHSEWESLRSQFVTSNPARGGRRYAPWAFTEHGVVMAANILKSKRAVAVSIEITRMEMTGMLPNTGRSLILTARFLNNFMNYKIAFPEWPIF